jgi:DNA-binding NtrC family response regulator
MKVLIVDDNPAVLTALTLLFDLNGLEVLTARAPDEAVRLVTSEDVGVVVQDMNFQRDTTSGNEGVALMRKIRGLDPDVPILLMTAFTSLEAAVQLVKEGASDYIAKPWNDEKLVTTVKNLLRMRELATANLRLVSRSSRARTELARQFDLRKLVYASPEMHEAVSLACRVAAADAPILVIGPNGSGKERIAEIIHANSRRKDRPLVSVNAGGLPDSLLDAELFGAEAGAFTGATKTRVGRFEEANKGTLFLDEIGNLSAAGQMKLLRVLQTGELQRLGSNQTRNVDVRIISATNADLPAMIRAGAFREDLYFRLNVIEVVLPPLRDRSDDVLVLATHFLGVEAPDLALGDDARQALAEHDWPGNVRELENRVKRAVLVRKGSSITREDLGLPIGGPGRSSLTPASSPARTSSPAVPENPLPVRPLEPGLDSAERAEVERALADARGVVSRAAALLGLSRQALYRKMERLGIEIERKVK